MIHMIKDFKQYKTGMIVDPEADLAAWLVSRKYAEPSTLQVADPAVQPEKKARRK